MTNSLNVEQPKVKTSFYLQPTFTNVCAQSNSPQVGLALGGQVQNNNTYAKAEVACGTYRKGNISVGHEFNIGKNMNLDLSANGQYMQNNLKSKAEINCSNEVGGYVINDRTTVEWNEGDSRVNGKAMLNFKGKAGKVGIGVEAGYHTNHGFEISMQRQINRPHTPEEDESIQFKEQYDISTLTEGAYVTPKLEAELNLDKKGQAKIVVNADLEQQNLGFRWTF